MQFVGHSRSNQEQVSESLRGIGNNELHEVKGIFDSRASIFLRWAPSEISASVSFGTADLAASSSSSEGEESARATRRLSHFERVIREHFSKAPSLAEQLGLLHFSNSHDRSPRYARTGIGGGAHV
jgi:hypothetical protein